MESKKVVTLEQRGQHQTWQQQKSPQFLWTDVMELPCLYHWIHFKGPIARQVGLTSLSGKHRIPELSHVNPSLKSSCVVSPKFQGSRPVSRSTMCVCGGGGGGSLLLCPPFMSPEKACTWNSPALHTYPWDPLQRHSDELSSPSQLLLGERTGWLPCFHSKETRLALGSRWCLVIRLPVPGFTPLESHPQSLYFAYEGLHGLTRWRIYTCLVPTSAEPKICFSSYFKTP